MELAFNTKVIGAHTGYGVASKKLSEALVRRGVEILPSADTILNFCMPPEYELGKTTIGYTPWESTEFPKTWPLPMRGVDDVWTTATWLKDIFQEKIPREDIFVLPHGIEPLGPPKIRRLRRDNVFWFLHVGEPAIRKGGSLVFEAWYKHFRNRKNVGLIIKSAGPAWCRVKDSRGHILANPVSEAAHNRRLKVISKIMSREELLDLYYSAHCLVYPSQGEGFGLIPAEAMATGLPTIIPNQGIGDFYKHAVLHLDQIKWVPSQDQNIHPGNWMELSMDDLIFKMEMMLSKYESYAQKQFDNTDAMLEEHSWDTVADVAIQRIKDLGP